MDIEIKVREILSKFGKEQRKYEEKKAKKKVLHQLRNTSKTNMRHNLNLKLGIKVKFGFLEFDLKIKEK
jgi:hypothetical protein